MPGEFELLDHSADTGLTLKGKTLEDLFEAAGAGTFWIIVKADNIEENQKIKINLISGSIQDLLVKWLSELIFIFATKHTVFSNFSIEIDKKKDHYELSAVCKGEIFNENHHQINTEIKGVTYHQLTITENHFGWEGKVIFDL